MSKTAEEFYRKKKIETAKTSTMRRIFTLVDYSDEAKIMEDYVKYVLSDNEDTTARCSNCHLPLKEIEHIPTVQIAKKD